jgi:hypothetical protein
MTARALPDPRRSHGAWVVLVVAVASGVFLGGRRVEAGVLAGTVFAGGFVALSALAVGVRRRGREFVLGTGLAVGCAVLAWRLGASPRIAVLALAGGGLGLGALAGAQRAGILSAAALVPGLAALTLSAPAAALAAGAEVRATWLLWLLLAAFSCWRSLRLARELTADGTWSAAALRARGLAESAYAALWALGVWLVLA